MGANGHLTGGTGDADDPLLLRRSHPKIQHNPSFPQQIFNNPAFPSKSTHSPQQKCRSQARKERDEEVGWMRIGTRRSSWRDKSSVSPAAIHNHQSKTEICPNPNSVTPKSKSSLPNLAPSLQCCSCAGCKRPERLLASAPAASQAALSAGVAPTPTTISAQPLSAELPEAPPTTNSMVGVAPRPADISAQSGSAVMPAAASDVGLVAGPVDPTKRSWADVVRSSAEVSPCPIEERCKGTCSNKISSLHKDKAHPWQQQIGDSEQSKAFKRWARGRCYRCLAYDHQVRSCKAPFRCIRCRGPGHRERHCRFRPTSTLSYQQKQTSRSPQKFGNCAAMQHSTPPIKLTSEAPSNGHHSQAPLLSSASERVINPAASASLDTKALVSALLKSLRAELVDMIEAQFETVFRPIREEMSTIKLWLARMATHFEFQKQEQDKGHLSTLNFGEFFGPYSPIRLSSTSTFLEAVTIERSNDDPLECEGACLDMANSSIDHLPVEHPRQKEQKSIQAVGQDKNTVLEEETCDDKPTPTVHMALEDPINIDSKVEESHTYVDQLMNDSSSSDITKTASHRRKSSGKPSSRRILKGLGLIKKNGKLDEDKLEVIADLLKEVLPPDVQRSLMRLKGRIFWDTLSKIIACLF